MDNQTKLDRWNVVKKHKIAAQLDKESKFKGFIGLK